MMPCRYSWLAICIILQLLSCTRTKDLLNPTELPPNAKMQPVVQTGHSAPVTSVAFSPDGQYVLSASQDHTLKLWDLYSGYEIRSFKGHTQTVSAVAFVPGSRFAVSGSWDATLKIWDVTTGEEVRSLEGHTDKVTSVSVSADGRHILSGSQDQSMIVWRLPSGSKYKVLRGHKFSVGYEKNPGHTSTGYEDRDHGALSLYYTYKLPHKVPIERRRGATYGHIDAVTSAVFDLSGQYVLSGGLDHTLRLWDLNEGYLRKVFSLTAAEILSVSVSPDGKYALCGASDALLHMVDIDAGEVVRTFHGHEGAVQSARWSSDGRRAVSADSDGAVILWDVEQGTPMRRLSGHDGGVNAVSFSPDGRYVLSGGRDAKMILWETVSGLQVRTLTGAASAVNCMAMLPASRYLLSGNQDGSLKLWDTTTGRQEKVYPGDHKPVMAMAVFDSGRAAVSGDSGGRITVWDLYRGKKRSVYNLSDGPITSLGTSPNGRRLLMGSDTGAVRLLDIDTGKIIWQIDAGDSISTLAFSPDGRFVLCAGPAKRFSLRHAGSGNLAQNFEGHLYGVGTVAFAADGRTVFSGGGDRTIRRWDLMTGRLLMTYEGHTGPVTAATVSGDGRWLLSGSTDQRLILWEAETGQPLKTLSGHLGRVVGACFSPDLQYLFSGSGDATIRKWHTASAVELGRLHGGRDGEWITTTPDGYYTKSAEGNHLVRWSVKGRVETYSYEQFEALFNKPGIVKERLEGRLESGMPAPELSLPPYVELLPHRWILTTPAPSYPLTLTAFSADIVTTVRVFVNGVAVVEIPVNTQSKEIVADIPLGAGANRITAIAFDAKGFSSNPKFLDVLCQDATLARPDLHVLSVGVSAYPKLSQQWQLEYAHSDAARLAEAMQNKQGRVFGRVHSRILTDEDATVDNITKVLEKMGAIEKNDVVVIHLAGHGVRDTRGTFYFLTSTTASVDQPEQGGLNWELLESYISKIRGRVILFLDACHSGSIVGETVVPNDQLAEKFFKGGSGGIMVFSASKGRQYSLEGPDIGGGAGVFTHALCQGLGPNSREADTNANGSVEFVELVNYVTAFVNRTTDGNQTPWLSRKELFGDLPIAEAVR